jgi:hypothetical protein
MGRLATKWGGRGSPAGHMAEPPASADLLAARGPVAKYPLASRQNIRGKIPADNPLPFLVVGVMSSSPCSSSARSLGEVLSALRPAVRVFHYKPH